MDAGRSFSYVFSDPAWVTKILIGGLLGITLVFLPSVFGYALDTARNVRDGRELPLPNWSDEFGQRWLRGLVFALVLLFWNIIFLVPMACLLAGFLSVLATDQTAAENLTAPFTLSMYCLAVPASLFLTFITPTIMVHFVNHGSFRAGFEVPSLWRIMSRDWSQYLLVFALFFAAGLIMGMGASLCLIGVIFTHPYGFLVQAHLAGQLSRNERAPRLLMES